MREVKSHFLLTGQIKPGDILHVRREMTDKQTRKKFDWVFLAVAKKVRKHSVQLIRLGADEGKDEIQISAQDDYAKWQVLDESEWPDGARAFRTVLMMEGRLDPDLT